jgi:hypothetical protein
MPVTLNGYTQPHRLTKRVLAGEFQGQGANHLRPNRNRLQNRRPLSAEWKETSPAQSHAFFTSEAPTARLAA